MVGVMVGMIRCLRLLALGQEGGGGYHRSSDYQEINPQLPKGEAQLPPVEPLVRRGRVQGLSGLL